MWIHANLNFLSVSSFNFSSDFMQASESAKSSNFIFLFDWFKRNADWRVHQTVVAREQEYIDWWPSLDICKMLCFSHVAACFLSNILDTCVIFHEIMFLKELSAFIALYFIQGALFFLYSAFLFLHSAFLILHSAFLKFSVWVSTCIFSPIVSQLRYFTFLPNCHAAIISISWREALISWLV